MMDPSRLMLTLLCGSGRGKVSPRVMVLLSEPSWFQQKAGHGMQTSSTKAVAHQMPQICSWATHGQNKKKKKTEKKYPPQRHDGSHQAADQRDRQLQDGQRLEEDALFREDELRVGDRHLLKALDVDVPRLQFLQRNVQGVSRCGGLSQEQRNQRRARVLAARAAETATPMPVDACAPTRLQNRLHGGAAVNAPCGSRRWAAAPAQPSPARPAAAAASRPSRPPASTLTLGCGQPLAVDKATRPVRSSWIPLQYCSAA